LSSASLHYADIIDATRKRHHEYLETLEGELVPTKKAGSKKRRNSKLS
jgi:hypothetical protein